MPTSKQYAVQTGYSMPWIKDENGQVWILEGLHEGDAGWVPSAREPYAEGEDATCQLRWSYRVYDEYEWDSCGEPAVACSLSPDDEEAPGRCKSHLPEFEYMDHWGFVSKPKIVLSLKDTPKGYIDESDPGLAWFLDFIRLSKAD